MKKLKVRGLTIKRRGKAIFKGLHIKNKKGPGGHIAGTCSSDDLAAVLEMLTGKKFKK